MSEEGENWSVRKGADCGPRQEAALGLVALVVLRRQRDGLELCSGSGPLRIDPSVCHRDRADDGPLCFLIVT